MAQTGTKVWLGSSLGLASSFMRSRPRDSRAHHETGQRTSTPREVEVPRADTNSSTRVDACRASVSMAEAAPARKREGGSVVRPLARSGS